MFIIENKLTAKEYAFDVARIWCISWCRNL